MFGHWLIPILVLGTFVLLRRVRRLRARLGYGGCHGARRFGGAGPWAGGGFPIDPIGWLLDDLHLTPEQRKSTNDIVTRVKESAGEVREAFRGLRGKLGEALRDESFNESTVGDLIGHLDTSLEKARKELVDTLASLHEVLDPSQRARLADWLERSERGRRPSLSL